MTSTLLIIVLVFCLTPVVRAQRTTIKATTLSYACYQCTKACSYALYDCQNREGKNCIFEYGDCKTITCAERCGKTTSTLTTSSLIEGESSTTITTQTRNTRTTRTNVVSESSPETPISFSPSTPPRTESTSLASEITELKTTSITTVTDTTRTTMTTTTMTTTTTDPTTILELEVLGVGDITPSQVKAAFLETFIGEEQEGVNVSVSLVAKASGPKRHGRQLTECQSGCRDAYMKCFNSDVEEEECRTRLNTCVIGCSPLVTAVASAENTARTSPLSCSNCKSICSAIQSDCASKGTPDRECASNFLKCVEFCPCNDIVSTPTMKISSFPVDETSPRVTEPGPSPITFPTKPFSTSTKPAVTTATETTQTTTTVPLTKTQFQLTITLYNKTAIELTMLFKSIQQNIDAESKAYIPESEDCSECFMQCEDSYKSCLRDTPTSPNCPSNQNKCKVFCNSKGCKSEKSYVMFESIMSPSLYPTTVRMSVVTNKPDGLSAMEENIIFTFIQNKLGEIWNQFKSGSDYTATINASLTSTQNTQPASATTLSTAVSPTTAAAKGYYTLEVEFVNWIAPGLVYEFMQSMGNVIGYPYIENGLSYTIESVFQFETVTSTPTPAPKTTVTTQTTTTRTTRTTTTLRPMLKPAQYVRLTFQGKLSGLNAVEKDDLKKRVYNAISQDASVPTSMFTVALEANPNDTFDVVVRLNGNVSPISINAAMIVFDRMQTNNDFVFNGHNFKLDSVSEGKKAPTAAPGTTLRTIVLNFNGPASITDSEKLELRTLIASQLMTFYGLLDSDFHVAFQVVSRHARANANYVIVITFVAAVPESKVTAIETKLKADAAKGEVFKIPNKSLAFTLASVNTNTVDSTTTKPLQTTSVVVKASSKKNDNVGLAVGVTFAVLLVIGVIAGVIYYKTRQNNPYRKGDDIMTNPMYENKVPMSSNPMNADTIA
eukprot:m.4670 g.4670  ORF g.4670 m.4670 type:complete len:948 (+) comp3049_c0_seq1:82-2925(+)